MRESLILLLEAVVKGDARAATEAYLEMAPATEDVNRTALLADIKVGTEIRRSDLAHVSLGDAFSSLMSAGSRTGCTDPGEFVSLTRAFVILESMTRALAPDHDYMESFREEIVRLTKRRFLSGADKGENNSACPRIRALGKRCARRHATRSPTYRRRQSGPTSEFGGPGRALQQSGAARSAPSPSRLS